MSDIFSLSEPDRRRLMRTDWGIVHQNPRDGLRMNVSAGGNVGERLMAIGQRHYGNIRAEGLDWLAKVELDASPRRPHAQDLLGRHAAAPADRPQPRHPAPAGVHGRAHRRPRRLGAGAPARPAAGLVRELGIAAIVVTHDLAVVRLLADRLMVMWKGNVVEHGLTDQVLDDPHHPYTQLLVSSVLQV